MSPLPRGHSKKKVCYCKTVWSGQKIFSVVSEGQDPYVMLTGDRKTFLSSALESKISECLQVDCKQEARLLYRLSVKMKKKEKCEVI